MKNRLSFRILIALLTISLLIFSCREDEPKSKNFSWSPDGKKLAIITDQSKELLIADIETDSIGNVSVIDNYRGKENDIFAPRWSCDGKYFLYTKIENENSTLLIYSVSNNDLTLLNTIPIGLPLLKLAASKPVHFPEWAPDKNLVLFAESSEENDEQLVTINPDGSDKKVLTQSDGDFIFPTWSPDGQWIAYSVENGKNAGVWKMKSDGSNSKKIFSTKNILQLKWAPDGSKLAFLQKSIEKKDSTQVLKLIDSDGLTDQVLCQIKNKINDFDWSPNGEYISYVQENDKKKNTWLVEIKTLQKTRLTFDNVKDYFGWQKPDLLLFTIKQPETILDLSESQKNKQEISELIRGVNKENVLISFNTNNFSKIIKNILTYKFCPTTNAEAFMQICRTPELLGNEIYVPAVKFPNGNIDYLPRKDEEYIVAADNQFLNQEYDKALKHINNYWKIDMNSIEFKTFFNADSIIRTEKINQDSTHVDLMIESLRNGALIKTIMILDRLKQEEKISWLFDQYYKLISFYLENEKDNQDEIYWNLIAAYGKYGEFDKGIKDLDNLLVLVDGDSLFYSYTNLACAFLALENESYDKCLEKVKASFENMPAEKAELEPYNTLISVFLEQINYEYNPDLILLLEQFMEKYPNIRDTFDTMALLGDYYLKLGENEKALINYQKAVSTKPDKQHVWDKIFELEMR